MAVLYLPTDAVTGASVDVDLAADYLELSAFFGADGEARTSDLANAVSLAAAGDQDDRVDVLAARRHRDGLPGFPLAAAQVATGADAREKSLRGHLCAFRRRWFKEPPETDFMPPYMIVPFAMADDRFVDYVRVMGNVLHRLRVPQRVEEAARLVETGVAVEGYDRLAEAARWVVNYRDRARAAA